MKIVFMATSPFALPTLHALHKSPHEIIACYTTPPQKQGRGLKLVASSVQQEAEKLRLEVSAPTCLDKKNFAVHNCDIAIVIAYGLLLPKEILAIPKFGCYNGHASLLPRWRGAAPIERAIMAGDKQTGISIIKMNEKLDEGDCAFSAAIPIAENTNAKTLHEKLANLCAEKMLEALTQIEQGKIVLTPQNAKGVCYAKKITKEEYKINWNEPAQIIQQKIMGLANGRGAFCEINLANEENVRVKIFDSKIVEKKLSEIGAVDENFIVACGKGALKILTVQKAGGKIMNAQEFLRGNKFKWVQ